MTLRSLRELKNRDEGNEVEQKASDTPAIDCLRSDVPTAASDLSGRPSTSSPYSSCDVLAFCAF